MAVKVSNILEWLNEFAPFDEAESWDNVGLLVGHTDKMVKRVMTSLDITPSVIKQAISMGAELIISHHPVIFNPITRLDTCSVPYNLAQHGIAAIGAHTNLDKAVGGVNDVLAKKLSLNDVYVAKDGLCHIGTLAQTMQPDVFAEQVGKALNVPNGGIQWVDGGRDVRIVGVCSGAGGDYLQSLIPQVDAFVTGELHYHEWPMQVSATIITAGHFYTEVLIAQVLAQRIAKSFPTLTVKVAQEQCPYCQL